MKSVKHFAFRFIIVSYIVWYIDCLEDFGESEFSGYIVSDYEEPTYSEEFELIQTSSGETFSSLHPILTEFATEFTEEINKDNKPKIQCKSSGYLPDPSDCRKFFSCVSTVNGFQIIPLSCVAGTIFESIGSKCTNVFKDCESYKLKSSSLGYDTVNKNNEISNPLLVIAEQADAVADTVATTELPPKSTTTAIMEPDAEYLQQKVKEGKLELLPGFTVQSKSWNDMSLMGKHKSDRKGTNKVIKTTHSTPNAWFGLVKATNPGNPFKDEETSLAIILDFNTARLQIYSRNAPRKRVIKK